MYKIHINRGTITCVYLLRIIILKRCRLTVVTVLLLLILTILGNITCLLHMHRLKKHYR